MKLVIFDLDQTLVDFISVHDEAMLKLFRKFFRVDARLTEVDFAGRSLLENILQLARLKGIPEDKIKEKGEELLREYGQFFKRSLPDDLSGFVLPGAPGLLHELAKTDNMVVLYTGSPPDVVELVLRATGLGKYFKFFLSGTEAQGRIALVKLAIDKAQRMANREFKGKDIVIIGDSLRDIETGRHFNALTIAVATGFHPRAELLKLQPDYLFENLKDCKGILRAIST